MAPARWTGDQPLPPPTLQVIQEAGLPTADILERPEFVERAADAAHDPPARHLSTNIFRGMADGENLPMLTVDTKGVMRANEGMADVEWLSICWVAVFDLLATDSHAVYMGKGPLHHLELQPPPLNRANFQSSLSPLISTRLAIPLRFSEV